MLNLYYKTINQIDEAEETIDVIYQNKNIKKLNTNEITLESKNYQIPIETINIINSIQSERLNEFNDIILHLKKDNANNKDIKTKIIKYLNNKELKKIMKKNNMEKKKQDNYINYIIVEKP